MAERDWRQRVAEEFETNPLFAATIVGACGAILGLTYAAMNSTPEKRREFRARNVQNKRERKERDRQRQQFALQFRIEQSYFSDGPGKDLFDRRGYIAFPAAEPFPDSTFEPRSFSMGGYGFTAESLSAGVRLSADYRSYDGYGHFDLLRPDGSSRSGSAGISGSKELVVYPRDDLPAWEGDARLMARLIAGPESFCAGIKLLRPNHREIRAEIWQEYLRDNPHIARAVGVDIA
jgi:hypothetical protein